MKKYILSLIVSMSLLMGLALPVSANEDTLSKAKQYWLNYQEELDVDGILAVESLGLDVENPNNNFKVMDFNKIVDGYGEEVSYLQLAPGRLAKYMMAMAAVEIDPSNFKQNDGTILNLVELLKSYVNEDGSVKGSTYITDEIYTVYALAIIDPEYDLTKIANYLVSKLNDTGIYESGWGIDIDTTGNIIGALTLCGDDYQTIIEKSIDGLSKYQDVNTGYYNGGYGANTNSQATILWGIAEYDITGLKNGGYNNAYGALLSDMQENGSFTFYGKENLLATAQAHLIIGIYENGSLFKNLRDQYADYLNNGPTEFPGNETKPEEPQTPPSKPNNPNVAVNTGDEVSTVISLLGVIASSTGGYWCFKRKK